MVLGHRGVARATTVALAAMCALPLALGVAQAKGPNPHPTPGGPPCPPPGHGHNGHPYPPKPCKAQTSRSSVPQGETVRVTGDGFSPSEPVQITLHTDVIGLGAVLADATGRASRVVLIPLSTPVGMHTVVLQGARSTNYLTAELMVTPALPHTGGSAAGGAVGGTTNGGTTAGGSTATSGSGLPFTGSSEAIPLAIAGLAMVGAGSGMIATVRRRRRQAATTTPATTG